MHAYASTIVWIKYLKASVQALAHYATIIFEHNRYGKGWFTIIKFMNSSSYIFDQSIWECNGHFDHWFSNIKSFLGSVWNLRKEKLYPEDFSMNTASNSSVERRVVNGRNAMAKHP